MKCAVLCNGPSRIDYKPSLEYNYVMGCNIPWVAVDATVIVDVNVLQQWKTPSKFYSSVAAWRELHDRKRFTDHFLGFVNTITDYDSAGHAACRKILEMKPNVVDIYGCDSWFDDNTNSYTHQFVDSRSDDMTKNISVWRSRWHELMDSHQNVQFNFIRQTN